MVLSETVKAILIDARCRHDTAINNATAEIAGIEDELSNLKLQLKDLHKRRAEIQVALDGQE